ncbi:winged helix-turn-helix transcriptional regulator [Mycolicibacterium helvum]|uniref:Transcriptional regulator n=1 Tax=Mycolicibacterium helvum TaxID=1534349 RepID=A0A7I7T565_9MYCO|nr:winged helix-turn-helix transcriptional regulator [Mycolicibacterium helvum]BBY63629.1 transcriptional regulator [Mycolicibacterium helvum]
MSVVPAEYCPVSIGASALGDRWSLLIVREVMAGSYQFSSILRGLPGLSRSLLAGRLRHLEGLGILKRIPTGAGRTHEYRLTEAGEDLHELIYALGRWTVKWWFPEPLPDQVDNALLLWRMRAGITSHLPQGRTTIQFDFTDGEVKRAWIVATNAEVSVCLHDPGFAVDLSVTGSGRLWHEIWYGHRDLSQAIAANEIIVEGPAKLVRSLPKWFAMSPFSTEVLAAKRVNSGPSASGVQPANTSGAC